MKKTLSIILGIGMVLASTICFKAEAAELYSDGWNTVDGQQYWYEKGVRQGTEGRGKEIYDPDSDAWYWLDAIDGGKKAVSKDVYQESSGGKWVRYDENGHMVKGWDEKNGNKYYFDKITGAMLKGSQYIDGQMCFFDEVTGIYVSNGWHTENGIKYWYENGVKQGTEGRGKEIYDPASDAWYWLDAIDGGKMAVSKDVYQESSGGKWVRYDENGHMIKGWDTNSNGTYYFEPVTGAMLKGYQWVDGTGCWFDDNTGILYKKDGGLTVTKTKYYMNDISIDKVDGATGYNIYRSTSPDDGYQYIGTTTSLSYTDDDLNGSTTYYYRVYYYTTDSSGNNTYSSYCATGSGTTAEKPSVSGHVANSQGYTYFAKLYIKNKGSKTLTIGGSPYTNFCLFYPYDDASYTAGHLLGNDLITNITGMNVEPGVSGYVYFELESSRYVGSGASIAFFFEYDGCQYTAVIDDTGSGGFK